jgi:ABC-type glycerol-3-phosphate transport system permease component
MEHDNMIINKQFSIYTVLKIAVLAIVLFAALYPMIYMVAVSLSTDIYVLRGDISFYPKGLTLDTFSRVMQNSRLLNSFKNTIVYVSTGTALSLMITAMAAFALSKNRIMYYKFFTLMVIITMYFGGGMIPTYLLVRQLGLIDKIWAVILPSAMSTYNLLVMRSFFDQFPNEIEDSGRMDGLNDIQIFWKLVLPVSKAVLVSIGLFYAVSKWNAFFEPFLYLTTTKKFPLQLILREVLTAGQSNASEDKLVVVQSLRYATIIVSIFPIIAVYPFLQKHFVKGVMIGAVKG